MRAVQRVVLVVLPLLLVAAAGVHIASAERHGSDFATFYDAGRAVIHGHSPYPALASLPATAGRRFAPFVYPPVTAFSFAPLSVLPFPAAVLLFFLLELAAVALGLRLLGVSDWRCYALVYCSAPLFASGALGTITPLLFLAVAAAWRFRNCTVRAGLLVAYLMTAKLFLWPLWLWLVRTRRYGSAAVAAVGAALAVFASWTAIGFAGLRDYPRLLGRMTELEGPHGYSLYALARTLGAAPHTAQTLVYVAAVVAIAAAAGFVRGDREWLAVTIGIAFLSTPILWPHYLLLLFVPIALARRRLAGLWLAPLLLWFDATARSGGSPVRIGAILLFAAVILAIAKENGHSPTLILRHARERRDSKGWSTSHASWDSSPQ